MELQFSAQEYYDIAAFFEQQLEDVEKDYEILEIPVISTPQHFSQSTPEVRVLRQQSSLLQEQIREAIAIFHTLAAVVHADKDFKIHSLLKQQLKEKIKPFISYYDSHKK